jgi:hypothetical protein
MSGRHVLVVAALLASAPRARAGDQPPPPPPQPAPMPAPPAAPAVEAVVYGFVVPDQDNFVIGDAWVDVRGLHIEARYNYEGLHSGSIFLGANASAGDTIAMSATAMVGGVFGDTHGIAPGFRVTVTWWKLDLSTEEELVIEPRNLENSFFYSWSELGFWPWDWLRVGLVAERLRVMRAGLDFDRGLLAGVSFGKLTATVYELNAPWTAPTWVFALAAHF